MRFLKTAIRSLPCKLNHDEVHAYGKKLASVEEDVRREEGDQKQQKEDMKARLGALESLRSSLAMKVRREEEFREVECRWSANDALRTAELMRGDTGEIVETRSLTVEEMQPKLPAIEKVLDPVVQVEAHEETRTSTT